MTAVVPAGAVGQGPIAAWPLGAPSARLASRVDFRSLLAKEESGALQEETALSAMKTSLAAAAEPKASALPPGKPASLQALAQASARRPVTEEDSLDPLQRHRASLAPPDSPSLPSFLPSGLVHFGLGATAPVPPEAAPRALASLEHLVPALVRRVAWSGDSRRGTARLEIGAGELAGATLLVHADAGQVRVQLSVPSGVDTAAWHQRIAARLASRNISAQSVEVT